MIVICKDRSTFSLSEKKSKLLIDANGLKCELISIDTDEGTLIKGPRCDCVLRIYQGNHKGKCTFIELKGSNVEYACKQILNSISQLKEIFLDFILAKKSYIIASGNFPKTDVQNVKDIFSKKTKTLLYVGRPSTKPEKFPL